MLEATLSTKNKVLSAFKPYPVYVFLESSLTDCYVMNTQVSAY